MTGNNELLLCPCLLDPSHNFVASFTADELCVSCVVNGNLDVEAEALGVNSSSVAEGRIEGPSLGPFELVVMIVGRVLCLSRMGGAESVDTFSARR